MMIDPIQATSALRPNGGLGGVASTAVPQVSPSSAAAGVDAGADFASLISEAVADLASKLHRAEAVSVAGVKGTASMQDVVETVMSAEQTLQAAITVRDKIVSAYLEISRMAI